MTPNERARKRGTSRQLKSKQLSDASKKKADKLRDHLKVLGESLKEANTSLHRAEVTWTLLQDAQESPQAPAEQVTRFNAVNAQTEAKPKATQHSIEEQEETHKAPREEPEKTEQRLKTATSTLDELRASVNSSNLKIEELDQQVTKLNDEKAALQSAKDKAQSDIEEYANAAEDYIKKQSARIEQLEERISLVLKKGNEIADRHKALLQKSKDLDAWITKKIDDGKILP